MVLSSHRYDYYYQKHFTEIKRQCLNICHKSVMDMLAYYDMNTQLTDITNHMTSVLTFSDSWFSLKQTGESLVMDFVKKAFTDDGC